MTVHTLNPLTHPGWTALVERHPDASIFHTRGWLEALQRTYGYEPIAFTTSNPDADLRDGFVFCHIRSWITGRRLVSLPFSDHCDPLIEEPGQLAAVSEHLQSARVKGRLRYVEVRPRQVRPSAESGFAQSDAYCFHMLDLRRDPDALFRAFHKDSTQRKIRRAEREGLHYAEGRSPELLRSFYRLLVLTRRRHQLPPQPFAWFHNLMTSLGNTMTVRIVSHQGKAVAGIVTLRHRDTIVYKYGASDAEFHNLGGTHLLFWKTIQEGHRDGCVALDLGRSDLDNSGLITFKDRWGAQASQIVYWRHPAPEPAAKRAPAWLVRGVRQASCLVPHGFRVAAGRLLYRHVG